MPPEAESWPPSDLPGGPAFPAACPFFAGRSGPAPLSVLCVDDDPDLLLVTRLYLEQDGTMAVTTCPSPARALYLVKRTGFDIIVSDYEMPGMDGLLFYEKIRALGCRAPFFLFTGRDKSGIPGLAGLESDDIGIYIAKSCHTGSPLRYLRDTIRGYAGRKKLPAASHP